MSEWSKIEQQLGNGLEDVFEEIMLMWNAKMDGEWKEFVQDCKLRYEKGRKQHEGSSSTWGGWKDEDFAKNIREELIDACIYAAQRNVTATSKRR